MVLNGGQNLDELFADTWHWTGEHWLRDRDDEPGARTFHAMSYDPNRHRLLLFGGRNGDEYLTDLWSFDGERWTLLSDDGPVRRGVYASAFDAIRDQFLIHGGGDLNSDGWILESSTWAWSDESGWIRLSD